MGTLKDFVVRYNELAREERISTFSKGDLMKMAYGETYRNVDSALPMGMLEEEGISKDEYWHYVMDYNNNGAFGHLTDLFDVIAKKNPTIEVYNNMYELTDTLPILDAVKKYENQDILWQIKRSDKSSKYAKGSTVKGGKGISLSQLKSIKGGVRLLWQNTSIDEREKFLNDNFSYAFADVLSKRPFELLPYEAKELFREKNKGKYAKGSTVGGQIKEIVEIKGHNIKHIKNSYDDYWYFVYDSTPFEFETKDDAIKSLNDLIKTHKYASGSTIEDHEASWVNACMKNHSKEECFIIILKDSQFSSYVGKPKNEYTHNRLPKKAIVTKDSVNLTTYTPNTGRYLDTIEFTDPTKLLKYLNKNQIMAKGSTIKGFKKGDKVKTREGNIETVIRVNSNGNIETQENDYTHNPQTLELIPKHAKGYTISDVLNGDVKASNKYYGELIDSYKKYHKIKELPTDNNSIKEIIEDISADQNFNQSMRVAFSFYLNDYANIKKHAKGSTVKEERYVLYGQNGMWYLKDAKEGRTISSSQLGFLNEFESKHKAQMVLDAFKEKQYAKGSTVKGSSLYKIYNTTAVESNINSFLHNLKLKDGFSNSMGTFTAKLTEQQLNQLIGLIIEIDKNNNVYITNSVNTVVYDSEERGHGFVDSKGNQVSALYNMSGKYANGGYVEGGSDDLSTKEKATMYSWIDSFLEKYSGDDNLSQSLDMYEEFAKKFKKNKEQTDDIIDSGWARSRGYYEKAQAIKKSANRYANGSTVKGKKTAEEIYEEEQYNAMFNSEYGNGGNIGDFSEDEILSIQKKVEGSGQKVAISKEEIDNEDGGLSYGIDFEENTMWYGEDKKLRDSDYDTLSQLLTFNSSKYSYGKYANGGNTTSGFNYSIGGL